jgi:hypothetical protein
LHIGYSRRCDLSQSIEDRTSQDLVASTALNVENENHSFDTKL